MAGGHGGIERLTHDLEYSLHGAERTDNPNEKWRVASYSINFFPALGYASIELLGFTDKDEEVSGLPQEKSAIVFFMAETPLPKNGFYLPLVAFAPFIDMLRNARTPIRVEHWLGIWRIYMDPDTAPVPPTL